MHYPSCWWKMVRFCQMCIRQLPTMNPEQFQYYWTWRKVTKFGYEDRHMDVQFMRVTTGSRATWFLQTIMLLLVQQFNLNIPRFNVLLLILILLICNKLHTCLHIIWIHQPLFETLNGLHTALCTRSCVKLLIRSQCPLW